MSMSSFITKKKGKKGHISVFDPHPQMAPFMISSTCLVWSSCWYRLYNSISSSGIGTELPAKVYSCINPVLIVGSTDQTQSTSYSPTLEIPIYAQTLYPTITPTSRTMTNRPINGPSNQHVTEAPIVPSKSSLIVPATPLPTKWPTPEAS